MAEAFSVVSRKCSMGRLYFLRQLAIASREPGRPVIVIIDNAKYHHAKLHAGLREDQQCRFALDFLPPYRPELNPIERVWKRSRRTDCTTSVFPSWR